MAKNPYVPEALKYWCRICKGHTPFYEYSRPAGLGRAHVKCRQCDTDMDSYTWRRLGCGCFAGSGSFLLFLGTGAFLSGEADLTGDERWYFVGSLLMGSVPLIAIGLWMGFRGREFRSWARQQNLKTPTELNREAVENPVKIEFPPEGFVTRITDGVFVEAGETGRELPPVLQVDEHVGEAAEEENSPDRSEVPAENLEGAKLANADLQGANLKEANLKDADLQGADLRGADMRSANLEGADLAGANLQGADLNFADFSRANIQDADLRGAQGWRSFFSGAIGTPAHLPGDSPDG